jgi:4-amino-4-deoxy-L-arabinose transferase-like glycosyltransferase
VPRASTSGRSGDGAGRRRLVSILLVAVSVALVATSAYRAATSSFTHDESLSFAIFTWAPDLGSTANNHLLNTWLMRLCSSLFGNSELSLRSPNIVAHAIYLVSTLLLLKRLEQPLIQVVGFVLLALNPFVLDFFSLARGYGLALAFLMASLYLLARAHEEEPAGRRAIYAFLSILGAALALLANFSFLTYYVPMVLVAAWVVASDRSYRRFSRDRRVLAEGLLGAGALFALFPLYKLILLRQAGELYFGGDTGFFSDTVEGLVHASAYSNTLSPSATAAISVVLIGMALAALAVGAWRFGRHAEASLALVFAALLAGSAALAFVERYLFDALWPIERAAIYYIPLYVVAVLFGAQLLAGLTDRRSRMTGILALPVLAAALLCWQLVGHFDPHSSFDWAYDRHDKDAIRVVERNRAKSETRSTVVRLGDSWQMEPSLNFYRVTRSDTWLAPVTRDPVTEHHYEFVYGFEADVTQLRDQSVSLASYGDTNTLVVRVKR